MASKENVTKTSNEDKVELFVPRGYANDEPNLMIGVNGVNYLLPKGKTSRVPCAVKAEYERAVRAQEALDAKSASLLEKAAKPF